MKRSAGRLAVVLGAANLMALVLVASVSAGNGFWGIGDNALPADAIPLSEVARTLEAQGLGRIHSVDADKGAWLVKAVTADGRRVEFRIDAVTGLVVP